MNQSARYCGSWQESEISIIQSVSVLSVFSDKYGNTKPQEY